MTDASQTTPRPEIQRLDHAAYRCRDSEQTRQFYEDFLGLPLVEAFEIDLTKTGRATGVLHSFYQMRNGACIAFFEDPGQPFEFKQQHDFDLHLALTVDHATLHEMFRRGQEQGIETRGIADHGFIHSIYFRDPTGSVVELAAHTETPMSGPVAARQAMASWQVKRHGGG
jgi:catechol 2,3-dioxygenase-like lactoylglutathione lyase family enzyme